MSIDTMTIRGCVGLLCVAAAVASGQNWSNAGGNAQRNGMTDELGPDAPTVLWSGGLTSIIAWQPVIEGRRMYVVRQNGFPPEPNSNESPIISFDLDTGVELFRINIPFVAGDWTTWIAGVKDGRLYAARSGNGATSIAPLRCYDSTTGDLLWVSDATITSGIADGVVFAPDGDPVVADYQNITRFDAITGDTVWRVGRSCSVTGNCGGALSDTAVFVNDIAAGGHVIKKFDLETGAFLYQSTLMPGFLTQNTPMVGPDGSVYMNRTQNDPVVDFFYAFEDTGSALVERWSVPSNWTVSDELGIGPDGSVYYIAPGAMLTRLDPATGAVVDQVDTPLDNDGSLQPRMAIDRDGRVFIINGRFAIGRLYSFDADLTERWSVPVRNVNIGGPAMGPDGTLVVAGVDNVTAFRTDRCPADFIVDGVLNFFDVQEFLALFSAADMAADFNNDMVLNFFDIQDFLNAFSAGCP